MWGCYMLVLCACSFRRVQTRANGRRVMMAAVMRSGSGQQSATTTEDAACSTSACQWADAQMFLLFGSPWPAGLISC